MKRYQLLWAGALTLGSLALAAQAAHAQIKLPVFDPDQDTGKAGKVVWSAASAPGDFEHGTLVTATMNNGSKVIGTLVRVDRKNKGIYIRNVPGETPTLVLEKDMKSLEKAARPVGTGVQNITNPEIHRTVIWNGGTPMVTYYAPNLSPGEVDNLNRLEQAENDLARVQGEMDMNARIRDAQRVAIAQNQQTRELLNALLFQEAIPAARAFVPTVPYIPLPPFGYFPTETLNAAQVQKEVPRVDPAAYNQALQNYRQIHGLAYYQNGQLIAVSADNRGAK